MGQLRVRVEVKLRTRERPESSQRVFSSGKGKVAKFQSEGAVLLKSRKSKFFAIQKKRDYVRGDWES